MSNIVAIVGRPNVGKSTMFNRLTQSRHAITDEISGVTRDRHYGKSEWNGYNFSVIDTGGYVQGSDDIFESEIRKQVELAIGEANVILFLVDAKEGITDLDESVVATEKEIISQQLKDINKPEDILAKMINGKLNKFFEEILLLKQKFVINPDLSIENYLREESLKNNNEIKIKKFIRFEIGK